MLLETLSAARDMRRLNEIAGVLIRHGFADSVRRLGLADQLERAGTPLASASIAQVHRAQLQDGGEVIVKIRHPGITEVIEADLRQLGHVAALAETELS
jgi:predicted unusual protein kinase regulating ubiquinone biosynthesis (AarF/ABC1/UbiB family)